MLNNRKISQGPIILSQEDAINQEDELIKAKIINVFIHPENPDNIIVTLDFYYSLTASIEDILDDDEVKTGERVIYSGKYTRETFEYKQGVSPETIRSEMLSHWENVYKVIQDNQSSIEQLEGLSV